MSVKETVAVGSSGKSAKWMTITPEIAADWLAKNVANRPPKKFSQEVVANAINADRFMSNGETIKFSESGILLDGQNRLMSVVRTGKSIESLVVFGLPDGAFATIDQGSRRSLRDTMSVAGHRNVSSLSGAANLVQMYLSGRLARGTLRSIQNHEIAGFMEKHSRLVDSVDYCVPYSAKSVFPLATAAGCHYLFSLSKYGDKANDFIRLLHTGEMLSGWSPILLLRNRLRDNAAAASKLPRSSVLALSIKAWNAYATDRPVKNLRLSAADPFPAIIGLEVQKEV